MEDGEKVLQTFKEKILFKITAFFVLLGTFSLFAFLFLVPFVIDPAFTTIFMQFDPVPVQCTTSETINMRGTKNCTWSSCREGCTREVYNCTQIRVDYKIPPPEPGQETDTTLASEDSTSPVPSWESSTLNEWSVRLSNKVKPTHYEDEGGSPIEWSPDWIDRTSPHKLSRRELEPSSSTLPAASSSTPYSTSLNTNDSEWSFTGAKLFPNVKGCGYPPMLNCTIFLWAYQAVGTNFTCYYSKVDPFLVISDLDMRQVYLNLILATAIPIPSFIISVIYLAFAYFIIYAEEPTTVNPETVVPQETDELVVDEEENADKITLAEDKTDSLIDGLPDIDADDDEEDEEEEIQTDELPEKKLSPSNEVPPTGELIKPAAMMVVRPSSLQPTGPIAAV